MGRFKLGKLDFNEAKQEPQSSAGGKSFLELLLQESAEANGEMIPEELEQPIGEIPIPDRKKRFKFLRFPKLKQMLDMLENEGDEPTDAYVIMDKDELPNEELINKQLEKRDDTEEFLNTIESKLKHMGHVGRRIKEESPAAESLDESSNDFEETVIQSITEDENIISETLANLLAFQGKKKKAIKMYQALSLKFPEKSRFFAQKINELK